MNAVDGQVSSIEQYLGVTSADRESETEQASDVETEAENDKDDDHFC